MSDRNGDVGTLTGGTGGALDDLRLGKVRWNASSGRGSGPTHERGVRTPERAGEYRTAGAPRLLDRVRAALRTRHYSRRTEAAYIGWIRRFILFHNKRHPTQMAES